jgi:hypothetical protein
MPTCPPRRIGTVAALIVSLVACAEQTTTLPPADSPRAATNASSGWQRLPDAPLTPRGNAVMVSTGTEVLVIGGQDTHPCPPNANCVPGRIRRDGAALDLAIGTWRMIAPAPIPVYGGSAVVTDSGVYLLTWPTVFATGETPGGLLHYDIATDRWDRPGVPAGENDGLAVVGDSLLIYTQYAEDGHTRDRILDETGLRDLPPDPFAPSGLRSLVPVGDGRLILIAHELDRSMGARPSFIRAAELNLSTGTWRLLPKSNIVGGRQWWLTDGLLVAPDWGILDGGEVNNWGRSYPEGGIFDPETRRWLRLPTAPPPHDGLWHGPAVGGPEFLIGPEGYVLDPESVRWTRLPEPLPGLRDSRSAVWAGSGEQLVAFGGVVSSRQELAFTAQTWIWQATAG